MISQEIENLRHDLARSKQTIAQLERERSRPQARRFDPKAAFKQEDNEKENSILQPLQP